MDPKKNKPKTGSQPMNVDPATAARMSNLPAGGRKNIRIRKLSDEEKAQSRQSKIKGGLERVTGRSFGGGEPTAGGDVDPKTGNLLPKDPRRPKKNRNVGGPAGPGDIDPETGDLIERNMTAAERQQAANQRVADYRERKAAETEAKKRRIMTTPGRGLSKETAAGNQAVYDRIDAADANLKRLEAGRMTMPERMAALKTERDALEKEIAKDFDRADRAAGMTTPKTSGVGGYSNPTDRIKSTPMDAPITSPSNPLNKPLPPKPAVPLADRAREVGLNVPASMQKPSTPGSIPVTTAPVAQPKFNYNPTARAMGFGGGSSRRGLGLGGSRSGGELQPTSARRKSIGINKMFDSVQRGVENYLLEGVKKAGHPEAFELGLDKDTTSNTEYQKILRRKRIERAAMMSDPTHPHHETDDVSQDDVEAADRAARRRKRIGEAMEKQGMLFKTQAEPKTTTVVPAVVGKDRKRATDQRSRENVRKKSNPRRVGRDGY
jgi:hypothetical protein